jgi:predicted permease
VTWLRYLRRRKRDEDFARELEAHLAHETDDLIARGVSPKEARFAALRKLGNTTALREKVHERNSLVMLEAAWKDVSYGARSLRRNPCFAIAAVLSLALGIGANTAVFSLLHQLLLTPLPVHKPDELVFLHHPGPLEGSVSTDEPGQPSFSYPVFRALQSAQRSFTGLAGARSVSVDLSYENHVVQGDAHRVSGNYFEVLGVRAALGRLLSDEDDRTPGAHSVIVLSHRYWLARCGGDTSILNRTLTVNGHPMTIVGVAEAGFEGERRGTAVDVFVPISMNREITTGWNGFDDRMDHWVTLLARLRPGVTLEAAEATIHIAYRAQLEEDIQLFGAQDQEVLQRYRAKRIVLEEGRFGRGGPRSRNRLVVSLLMLMTLLVLLICCLNVANLLLARGANRAHEISLRSALGASRFRLVRQLLAEACMLGLCGAAVGLFAAHWFLGALLSSLPSPPGLLSAKLDANLLVFCLCLSLASIAVFGLVPALRSSRVDVITALKDQAGRVAGSRRGRLFGRSLVTVQLATSLLLLICAGLFARTFVNVTRIDLGMNVDRLLTFSLEPKLGRAAEAINFYERLTARLAAIPGVRLVSAARVPAIANTSSTNHVKPEGFAVSDEDSSRSSYNEVGPDYFRTMGIPLLAGREFTDVDAAGAPQVAIVNETFARHFLSGREPLGRRFGRGRGDVTLDIEIVGVVKDAKYSSMRETPPRVYYVPYRQSPHPGGLYFYLRTANDPETIAGTVQREVAALDPTVAVRGLKTMRRQIEKNVSPERLLSGLTGAFGGLAMLLASVGLYGVLAYDVARRTREIGIRMALGADASRVRALIARELAVMFAVGMFAGVGGAAVVGKLAESLLYETKPWDAAVYASAVAILGVVALAAAYVPARRASRVDPILALRHE